MTAENERRRVEGPGDLQCFNEAAADDRGKRPAASTRARICSGFNEAAADDRGKLQPGKICRVQPGASMRPRPMTAENQRGRAAVPRSGSRFNEAAADDRGKPPLLPRAHTRQPASMRPRPMTAENGNGTA